MATLALGAAISGLWWAQSASAARDAESTSRHDAVVILEAAQGFRALHTEGCPTLSALEEEHFLNSSARSDDAWGERFRVRCEHDEISVTSAGADHQAGTADDIRAPR